MAKPKSLVDLKKEGADKDLGNFKSLAQKRAAERNAKKAHKKHRVMGNISCKKVVKSFLETNNLKEAAKKAGISQAQASKHLSSERGEKIFKEVFKELGMDKESLSKIALNDFLEYNKQRVTKKDEQGREVEQMRDGKLAFKAFQFVAEKLESSKKEVEINHNVNINATTATLATKQLIKKIDEIEALQEVKQAIDNRIEELKRNNEIIINQ